MKAMFRAGPAWLAALCLAACSGSAGRPLDAALVLANPDGQAGDLAVADGSPDLRPADALPTSPDSVPLPDSFNDDAAPLCGNGTRDDPEECDDGNRVHLDGCDGFCRFEQVLRFASLRLQFGSEAFCPQNGFGRAFAGAIRDLIQEAWHQDIVAGRTNMLIHLLSRPDPTGTETGPVLAGVSWAQPAVKEGYDASDDLDWWYAVELATLRPMRIPLALLNGRIDDQGLALGPGSMPLRVNLTGSAEGDLVAIPLQDARLQAGLGPATAPRIAANAPPGHLPGVNLDPALSSFASLGELGLDAGRLCGNVGAWALRAAPAPPVVAGTGICAEQHGRAATLLDLLVGGCTSALVGPLVRPVQPDAEVGSAQAVGAGPPYRFTIGEQGTVDACTDKDGTTVELDSCLQDAAYSAFFRFTARRVIAR